MKIKNIKVIKPEVSFPDIDTDVGVNITNNMGRDDIVDYLIKKYGDDHVAYVGNRLVYSALSAIRDLAQVYDIPATEKNEAMKEYNNDFSVEDNITNSKKVKEFFKKYPFLKDKVKQLEGTISSFSIHAGGIILSDKEHPMSSWCSLQKTSGTARVATSWTKKEIEQIGLIKYDILGLSSASQIHYARKLIGLNPYEDAPEEPEVFVDVVANEKHKNIFQFETPLGKKAFHDFLPMSIMELANASGIIRLVGSDEGREVYDIYKNNIEKFQFGDKEYWTNQLRDQIVEDHNFQVAQDILKESYGVLIYQEQLSNLISAFSKGQKTFDDGNTVRKLLDKHGKQFGKINAIQGNKDALKKWHSAFMKIINEYLLPYIGRDGRDSNDPEIQDFLNFKLNSDNTLPTPKSGIIAWFISAAAYLFSKLHAIAYSVNTYNMMWLKHHHPLEFWTASLICEQDNLDKVKNYISAIKAEKTNIKILPPNINKSDKMFSMNTKDNSIRYGLGAIMNLGKSSEAIYQERLANGDFKNISDFINRLPSRIVNKKAIENLLYVNAFEDFGDLKSVHKELLSNGKAIDELAIDLKFLATNELKILGTNISFIHPTIEASSFLPAFTDVREGYSAVICVLVLNLYSKNTKKGKPYSLIKAQCVKSGEILMIYDWNNNTNAKLVENEIFNINIQKDDFIQLKTSKKWK